MSMKQICPNCAGVGRVPSFDGTGDECHVCHGTGRFAANRRLRRAARRMQRRVARALRRGCATPVLDSYFLVAHDERVAEN